MWFLREEEISDDLKTKSKVSTNKKMSKIILRKKIKKNIKRQANQCDLGDEHSTKIINLKS